VFLDKLIAAVPALTGAAFAALTFWFHGMISS